MKTMTFTRRGRTLLLSAVFFLTLVSTTALPMLINLPSASAGSDTYPTSISGCRYVSGPSGYYTCDLKDDAQDTWYDPWGEENRECTSYAAWMLHSVNGFEMPFYDSAYNWGPRAQALGYVVNMTPAVGSIYWKAGTGQYHTGQHVAYVESVSADGSTVTTEDYNSDFTGHWAEEPNVTASSASGYIHFKDLSSNRIAYVNIAGDVLVKSGSLSAPYTTVWNHTTNGTAVDVQMSPNRIAVLDSSGNLWASQWPMTGGFLELWAGGLTPSTYQIADNYVAVLAGGMVYTKVGTGLGGVWNPTINPVSSFKMAQNGNMAVVNSSNNTLYVAWGGFGNPWTATATNFSSYSISNNDIGAVFGSMLDIMVGAPVNNHWNATFNPAASVQLAPGGNIGVVDTSGYLDVAWGGYGSPWTTGVANNYNAAYVSDNQIGVLWGNNLDIKVGGATGPWTVVANDAIAFAIT